MEEQRARQEDEARKVAQQSAEEAGVKAIPEGRTRDVLWTRQVVRSFPHLEMLQNATETRFCEQNQFAFPHPSKCRRQTTHRRTLVLCAALLGILIANACGFRVQ